MNACDELHKTRIYCPTCGIFHPAELTEHEGAAYWHVACPRGEREVKISSDARLFGKLHAQWKPLPKWYRKGYSNILLHINDDCSLQCPICFANAARTGWRMSLAEVRQAAAKIRDLHPINVMLTGGEPSEHPDVVEIVRILSREFGLHTSMLTNGVRLGRDPEFAVQLKAAGLGKLTMSFDTFNPEVSKVIRGNPDLVQIKLQGAENCYRAGLTIGFTMMATRLNVQEIPRMLEYYIAHAGKMSMFDVQCYQDEGRCVPGLESVDREEIIKLVVASGVVPGLTEDDFRVSPQVPAAGYCIHTDCCVWVYWVNRKGQAPVPLERECDVKGLEDAMWRMRPGPRWWKWLRFFLAYVRHCGWRKVRAMRNWIDLDVPSNEYLQFFSILSLETPQRMDCKRFGYCTSGVLTNSGGLCAPCYYYALRYDRERKERT